jgi:hypothetical protein
MPEISLTDFVDFVIKAGSPKLTLVRRLFNRGEYSPVFDYWKQLREHIAQIHGGAEQIGSILEGVDLRKKRRYEGALTGHKKFLKRIGDAAYFVPPCERWTHSGLTVKVNPELGLLIDGKRHVIKLYFKDEEPTPHRLNAALALMKDSLKKGRFEDVTVAVLDVAKGKLITATKEDSTEYSILLAGEAAAFMTMWTAMSAKTNAAVMKAGAR